jgi:hypothetical protein
MRRRDFARRRGLCLAGVFVIVITWVASSAWACVPFASLRATPTQVEPGQEVTLIGSQFRPTTPVVIRLDTLDGPELARITVDSPKGPFFRSTIVIPGDVAPGDHVLVATQETPEWSGPPWGVPARTVITVGGGPHRAIADPPDVPRTADLSRDSVSAGSALLVALGMAVAAVLAFGGVAVLVSRRSGRPVPAEVRSR